MQRAQRPSSAWEDGKEFGAAGLPSMWAPVLAGPRHEGDGQGQTDLKNLNFILKVI